MYGVYNDFFQTAYADYQAEFEQLSKLGKSLAEDTVHAVQSGAEEVVKSATEKARTQSRLAHEAVADRRCRRRAQRVWACGGVRRARRQARLLAGRPTTYYL